MNHQAARRQCLQELPDSILSHILSYLSVSDHASLACTCVRFYQLVHHEKQTADSIVSRCFPNRDISAISSDVFKSTYFGDFLRVASSPMARLASDCIALKTAVDSHDFRAVYQPCGPSHRLTAYLYGGLAADPSSRLPCPLEGKQFANYSWLCWPDENSPTSGRASSRSNMRYRSPAQACLAQARADSSSGAPATSPPPSGSPTGSAAGGPTRAAPTDRSTPEDIAAAGEYSLATVLTPLFTLRTPQGLMLRFQLPESKGPSPTEQAWHFTIEALPSASSAEARGEPQPIHIMTQPHCMLLSAALPRMMHEFRTGLSIHKVPAVGQPQQIFVDFFIHYQHLLACIDPPDHLRSAGVSRMWAGSRYMHHSCRAADAAPPVATASADAARSPSGLAAEAAAEPDGRAASTTGATGDSGQQNTSSTFIVQNSAFEEGAAAAEADGANDHGDPPLPAALGEDEGPACDLGSTGDSEETRVDPGGCMTPDRDAGRGPEGVRNPERHLRVDRATGQAAVSGPEAEGVCESDIYADAEGPPASVAEHVSGTRQTGPKELSASSAHCTDATSHGIAERQGSGQGSYGTRRTARRSMGLAGAWLPRTDSYGRPMAGEGGGGRAPHLTTEAAWREAESTTQHTARELRMEKLSAMSSAQQSRAMASYLRQQMWLGCYVEPPMIGGDLFLALTMYQLPIRGGEDAVGEVVVAAPTLVGAMLMAEGGGAFDMVRGSGWMGDVSVAGLLERGRLQAAAPSPVSAEAQVAPGGDPGRGGGLAGRWVNLRQWWEAAVETFDRKLESVAADVVLVHRSGRTVLGRVAGELWRVDDSDDVSYAEMSVPFIFDDQVVYGAVHLGGLPRFLLHPRVNSLSLMLGNYDVERLHL